MPVPIFNSRSLRLLHAVPTAADSEALLGRIDFGLALPPDDDPRRARVGLEALGDACASECWISTLPVRSGWHEGFGYAENGEALFAQIRVPEAQLGDLEGATQTLYQRLGRLLHDSGYPHIVRIWNFLSDINAGEGDGERYRRFTVGRHRALAAADSAFEAALPAATAIGTLEPDLVLYLLAGRHPGLQVENPRQVSAFRYPREYGPKSPSFARATLIGDGDAARLLVSGTASIVGHESRHVGDPQRQLDEIIANVDALLDSARQHPLPGAAAGARVESLKLYLRGDHEPVYASALLRHLRGATDDTPLMVLRGDICRRELLLEIEAVYAIDRA
ncbi:hypothetical protein [Solimonas marina]|uniref:Chorismatase FkbO/Hyg5-like N-terminal domain-containing protein n=1 Tax=Solimonas marina TaxID=2714601 RepID=A0A970B527_9GAMM|nr:hypothetical protein [Solimonas marina]NKF21248.1 hypothetical protein [Solimonas marina]